MRSIHAALLAALLLLIAACAEPVPQARADYVGDWQSEIMRLQITAEGRVHYERRDGGSSKSIDAPIQRFEGDNFVVGFGPFNTTFVVSRPPYLDGARWKMVVDGVELTRRGGGSGEMRV